MRKIFTLFAVAAFVLSCSTEDVAEPTSYTLTGYSFSGTRTAFGAPTSSSIPFLWSEGDKIWYGGVESDPLTSGGASATFTVGSEPANGAQVYYNMTGNGATAVVPTMQDMDNTLGENGDFGYATISDGSFELEHATSYMWFKVEALPAGYTLESIRLHAGDAIVAGSAEWQGASFAAVSNGRSIIDLEVNRSSVGSEVFAMVLLPANITSAKVTYTLTKGGDTKYYEKELGAKSLAAGHTYQLSVDLSSVELKEYILRTLTFEDNHALFPSYTFTAPSPDYYNNMEEVTISVNKWSDLIVAEDEQSYQAASFIYGYSDYFSQFVDTNYNWKDSSNTGLAHRGFAGGYGYKSFDTGGHAISKHYASVDDVAEAIAADPYSTTAPYRYQIAIPIAAHSGNNFVVGFHSATEGDTILPVVEFEDGVARVVESMMVTNTSVVRYAIANGFYTCVQYGAEDFLDVEVTGYNGSEEVGTRSFRLVDGATAVDEWTKWDLSSLGKVTKLCFRMKDNQVSSGWYSTPVYFAYDDVVVRFE